MKTFEEIGADLGMSPSTAASLYYRGLRKLRERVPNALEVLSGMAAQLEAERRKARSAANE